MEEKIRQLVEMKEWLEYYRGCDAWDCVECRFKATCTERWETLRNATNSLKGWHELYEAVQTEFRGYKVDRESEIIKNEKGTFIEKKVITEIMEEILNGV